jgi:alpha-beta hydrolase superfamily lysophospholipase
VFAPPSTARVRGTVHLFVGRGETPAVYARFATRLTTDGYRVVVGDGEVSVPDDHDGLVVLVGVDSGALNALALAAANPSDVDGLILVGLPGRGDLVPRDWDAEVTARASCPTQQAKLREGHIVSPGRLVDAELFEAAPGLRVDVPSLAFHGTDDPISPLVLATARYSDAGIDRLLTVLDGRHDVLNSVHHRTVAAEVVQFLETLRVSGERILQDASLG